MIDEGFFQGIGDIRFEETVDEDTFEAIDEQLHRKQRKLYITMVVISGIMVVIPFLL